MRATIVFDLDYTLLDTSQLMDEIATVFVSHGVSHEHFRSTYAQVGIISERIRDYHPHKHVKLLESYFKNSPENVVRDIAVIAKRMPEFVLAGTSDMLKRLRTQEHTLVLLTHGNPHWQGQKVVQSGLATYFDKIIYAIKEKELLTDELNALQPPVIMINDNGKEIDELQKVFNRFSMIAMRGPKTLPSDTAIPICDTIAQVEEQINDIIHRR